MSAIKTKLKKYGKIGILLGIKESYLFLRNLLGLKSHPFRTLRVVWREKDRSQQVLLLGIPVYVLGVGLAGVWLGRRLLATSVEWGMAAKMSFAGVMGISILLGVYLGYWGLKVWRMKYE